MASANVVVVAEEEQKPANENLDQVVVDAVEQKNEHVSNEVTVDRSKPDSDTRDTVKSSLRVACKSFMDLPEDLQSMVFSFIIRPRDLVALCLTCSLFHQLSVKYLYKVIELDVGGEADKHLPALLNPENIGVKHIREVELYRADILDKCDNQLRQASFAVRMLLEMLPRNQLTMFRWHPWDAFPAENMTMLVRRQKNLEWFGAIRLDKTYDDAICKQLNLDTCLSNVKKVGLYPDSRDTIDFSRDVLSRVKKLESFILHTDFESDEESPNYISNLNDTPTHAGLLTSGIFQHLIPFEECSPMTPTSITLERVNLRYCTETYCRVLDFSKVQKLVLCHCTGVDALLAAMCRSTNLPQKLIKFELKHDDDEEEGAAINALDTFLCLASGIENLTLDIGGTKRLPLPAGITRHGKTLKMLNCHTWRHRSGESSSRTSDEKVFEQEAMEKITKACTKLEQISLAFPPTSIGQRKSEEFDAFCTCLGNLPNLITCNVTTWPGNKSGGPLPRQMYEHLLAVEAQEAFEANVLNTVIKATEGAQSDGGADLPKITAPKLSVIAWGISDRIYEREDSKNIAIFVKGKTIDPLGGPPKVAAVRISMSLKHYFQPRTEVLDTPLSRSQRPPVRENEDMDDW